MSVQRPIVPMVFFFALGIILASLSKIPLLVSILLTLLCLGLSVIFRAKVNVATVFALFAVLMLGLIWTQSYTVLPMDHIKKKRWPFVGNTIYVEGIIISDVTKSQILRTHKTSFVLELKSIRGQVAWPKAKGKILVQIFRDADINYGDIVILEGKLHYPFEFSHRPQFSYRDYLGRKEIYFIVSVKKSGYVKVLATGHGHWWLSKALHVSRQWKGILHHHLSRAEAGIMQAMVLGDTTQIDGAIEQLYLRTGTAHILAVSGFNVGIVTGVIFLFLRLFPIGRKAQLILTMMLLIFYAVLTGAKPPVVRATIMAIVFLFSFILEREIDGLNSLFVAAFLIFLLSPLSLFEIGFQLSFVSVLAIIVFFPYWNRQYFMVFVPLLDKMVDWLKQSFILSLTAWVGVAGLIAYYFDIVTPITILANLVVVPLSATLVVLGLGLVASGMVWPLLAHSFAMCIKFILNVMIWWIYIFDQFPFAHFYLNNIPPWSVVIYYVLIVLLFYLPFRRQLTK